MGFYEKQWLKEFNFCKVLLYRRYVDDIICLFNCEVDAMKLFDYLNFRHPNIKFTFEKQNGGKLAAFLDILISNKSDNFCTSVFRKKASIGLYSNLPVSPLFRKRLGYLKLCFTVLSKLVVLGFFSISKNKKLKICY